MSTQATGSNSRARMTTVTITTTYRRFIPQLVPGGRAGDVPVFASRMVERLRIEGQEKVRRRAELDDWEDEGGSVAATDVAAP
jgi:hypothetical protein